MLTHYHSSIRKQSHSSSFGRFSSSRPTPIGTPLHMRTLGLTAPISLRCTPLSTPRLALEEPKEYGWDVSSFAPGHGGYYSLQTGISYSRLSTSPSYLKIKIMERKWMHEPSVGPVVWSCLPLPHPPLGLRRATYHCHHPQLDHTNLVMFRRDQRARSRN